MHDILIKWGGRRFLLTVGCSIAATVLVWHGKISDSSYVTLITLTAAAYITGNTIQKVKADHDRPESID